MRKFWITYKIQSSSVVIEGDATVDMPEGNKLNAEYLQAVKNNITNMTEEQLRQEGKNLYLNPAKLLILSCIELEE